MKPHFFSAESLRIQVYLFLFCLPILEAPKNLLILTSLITFIGIKHKKLELPAGTRQSAFVFALLFLSAAVPVFWSPFDVLDFFDNAFGWLKYLIMAGISAAIFSAPKDQRLLLGSILGGLSIAIIHSFIEFQITGAPYPELKSVGHVNQSAIYLAMGILIGLFAALTEKNRILAAAAFVIVICGAVLLVPMRSVIATASLFLAVIVLFAAAGRNRRGAGAGLLVGVAIGVLAQTQWGQGLQGESLGRVSGPNITSKRLELFNAAWVVAVSDMFLGTGIRSFGEVVTPERIANELTLAGKAIVQSDYYYSNHGHGLWTTTIVERGILGWLAFVSLGVAVIYRLWLVRSAHAVALVGSVGVFIAACSFGNTTFHNEHGALALLVFFIFLNSNLAVVDAA